MSIWGKLLGGATGFALGGPLGALLGGLAGHAVDHVRATSQRLVGTDGPIGEAEESHDTDDNTRRIAFTIAVIVLGAKMAKADGTVRRSEIRAFREVFHVPPEELDNVGRIFNQARRDSRGYEPYAKQMARLFRHSPHVLEELLNGLFHIARADGVVSDDELAYLRDLARIFGLDEAAWQRVHAGNMPEGPENPYAVLGVDPNASDADIKTAYRRLVRENHPDRLTAQGMPREFIDTANDKLAAINDAFETIRKQRGLT